RRLNSRSRIKGRNRGKALSNGSDALSLNNPRRREIAPDSREATHLLSAVNNRRNRGNSKAVGAGRADGRETPPGSKTAPEIGRTSTAPGRSAAAMAVTTFLKIASASISVHDTRFRSRTVP